MEGRRALHLLVLVSLLGLASPAGAKLLTIDAVPAATLLLPYFEVALGDANGPTTLFSINNASATAVLAHVVIWSDLSVPVFDFNVYLTGYDVQTINLRDILINGVLPQTASSGQDPGDTLSPKGALSQDINFASCTGQLPPPKLPGTFISHLQASLTGKASPILGNLCAGRDLGDNLARGYVTVDTVNNCTLRIPSDSTYFTTDVTDQNVLWGDYFYVDPSQNSAEGGTLVHIEASASDPETSVPGQYTFYGRYVSWMATDHREPLATNFDARFAQGGNDATSFLVWRDSKVSQAPFTCGALPTWYPLGEEEIVIFDEEETPFEPETFPVSPQPPQASLVPFPAETQKVGVGSAELPSPFEFGWVAFNLNTEVTAAGNNPPEDKAAAQAWVFVVMEASVAGPGQLKQTSGSYSSGYDATRPDCACQAAHKRPSQ